MTTTEEDVSSTSRTMSRDHEGRHGESPSDPSHAAVVPETGSASSIDRDDGLDRVRTTLDQELPPETILTTTISGPPYSIFTKRQKRFIVFMAAFGASFSPISGNIYFPALNVLSVDLGVSNADMNLTLTTYMIFQGLAPSLMGDLADTAGRRPAYLLCLVIYVGANIGLALQNSYAALLVLRCLQSGGSGATLALASGIVGDISTAAERGTYQGVATIGSQLGPSLGPVLGGLLAEFLGWRSIFWFLIILAAVFLLPFTLFFPETSRNVVGNGSIAPQPWNMTITSYLKLRRLRKEQENSSTADDLHAVQSRSSVRKTRKFRFPNPLACFRILSHPATFMLLVYNAFLFSCFYYILSTIPPQYAKIYGFNTLKVGLCYIPFGIGGSTAAFVHGQILDWNFRRTARKLGMKVDRKRQTDMLNFPIEKARLQISLPLLYAALSLLLIYGWVLEIQSPLAAPLVVLFFLGYCITSNFNTSQTLLVDFHPTTPSTATAANNLLRCLLGAGSLALLDPIIDALGIGGTFSLQVGILVALSPLLWVLYFKGMKIRQKSYAKAKAKEAEDRGSRDGPDKAPTVNVPERKHEEELPQRAVEGMTETQGPQLREKGPQADLEAGVIQS